MCRSLDCARPHSPWAIPHAPRRICANQHTREAPDQGLSQPEDLWGSAVPMTGTRVAIGAGRRFLMFAVRTILHPTDFPIRREAARILASVLARDRDAQWIAVEGK